jgi:Vitamin B6 photo-protection and homoeostasis
MSPPLLLTDARLRRSPAAAFTNTCPAFALGRGPGAPRAWRRNRRDRVDPEELESENEPVSSSAAAVEYLRNGKREFFIEKRKRDKSDSNDSSRISSAPATDALVIHESTSTKGWRGKATDRVLRYFLPSGYPQSVGPRYAHYTRFRFATFFFGGCVGVYSTQGLLLAVGVGRQSAAPLAAALQWVIRDGLGRAGRMLFGQVGSGFDSEVKQYRLFAAVVLNMSCALESITPAFPQLFLPLACFANMAKGASTVAAASTRSAIYRSFMRSENLGDITAKQETVGVAGDLCGTAVGIMLSRLTEGNHRLAMAAFCTVSFAHLISVYNEIKGIQLGTLNRQRAHMLIKTYLTDGRVPDLANGNCGERILNRPWLDSLHAPNIDLGSRLHECAPDAEALA